MFVRNGSTSNRLLIYILVSKIPTLNTFSMKRLPDLISGLNLHGIYDICYGRSKVIFSLVRGIEVAVIMLSDGRVRLLVFLKSIYHGF